MNEIETGNLSDQIAIIGMACRFPGARNVDEYWHNLRDGVEAVSHFSDTELLAAGVDPTMLAAPGHVKAGSVLEDIELFDAGFFDFSPRQAELTDPQQRVFLECAWEALESAGCDPDVYEGAIGVYAGSILSNYLLANVYPAVGYAEAVANLQTLIGNDKDYLATHVSYKLNLKGPSVNIQTACSTSLVAVHLACQSLINGECDMALAGGVAVRLPQKAGYLYQDGGIFSPDGHCRPFDAAAQGTIFGSGLGIVVLKRLEDALAEGDRIEAIILGSAINNDGSHKIGYTAPSEDGQAAVVEEALVMAEVAPETIGYVETHGTGTPLGDPIEVAALTRVFRTSTDASGFCALGAVKSNLGHMETAAGIAGLIKTVLALQHKQIPQSLNYEKPNSQIDFAATPFYVNTKLAAWPQGETPRRAGVSAFGIGGTNAHVVLEEAPPQPATPVGNTACLLPLSARTAAGLQDHIHATINFLQDEERGAALSLTDIGYTAALRRRHFEYRTTVAGRTHQELVLQLEAALERDFQPAGRRKIVFVFPGQGSQWLGMGQQLWQEEPVFRATMEACEQAIGRFTNWSLQQELMAGEAHSRLAEIDVVQPILFAIQAGLAALWRSWGIEPDAVVGHSMGEVAAAHVAGVLSLQDAAQIICRRSQLLRRVSGQGAMAVVGLTLAQAQAALAGYEDRLSVAVSNSPKSTVLSGDPVALEALLAELKPQGVFCRRIKVDVASHSPQMDPLRADLLRALSGIQPQPAEVSMISTVTGQFVQGAELAADYWAQNLRRPVLFAPSIQKLVEDTHDVFIEISPHPILLPAIEDSLFHLAATGTAVSSLRRDEDEQTAILTSLGELYSLGRSMAWDKLYVAGGQCVRLPGFPWQRQRYWLEPANGIQAGIQAPLFASRGKGHPLLGQPLRSALKTKQFEVQLSSRQLPYLDDHRICGRVILPATAYLEMAWAAGSGSDTNPPALGDIVLHEPLFLEEAATTVQFVLDEAGQFQVFSHDADVDAWRLHASGSLRQAGDSAVAAPSLAEAQADCCNKHPASEYYQQLYERGFAYGPAFQGIEQLWQGEGSALGLIRLPATAASPEEAYTMHPALLDAALQVMGAAITPDNTGKIYLPMSLAECRLHATHGESVWSYVVMRPGAETMSVGDVYLFDEAGQPVAEVTGLCLKRISPAALQPLTNLDDWFYRVQWQPLAPTPTERPENQGERWLIFADAGGVGVSLVRQLTERGHACALVFPDEMASPTGLNCVHVDPAQPEAFTQLLAQSCAPFDGVVYLWGLDATPTEQTDCCSLAADQRLICGSALHLTQALARAGWSRTPKLWLVTRGAQPVGLETASLALAQLPLWGLGKTINLEHPDLGCRCVDLDTAGVEDATRILLAELEAATGEDQVAFRQGRRYVPRLVRCATGAPATPADADDWTNRPFQLTIPERGVLDNLTFESVPRQPPGPGEVEIRVLATGLNFRDILNALGMYPGEAGPLGLECAGQIVAVGAGVPDLRVGDEVVAFAPGTFRMYVTVAADYVALKPARLSFAEAATIPVTFMTAHFGLNHLAQMKAGDRVLIHAAAGGVGMAAVQLAQQAGAEVFATASSPEKWAALRALGVQHIMNSRTLDFADEVMALTDGGGVDIVLNSLSGEFVERSVSVLAPNGRFVEIGKIGVWDNNQMAQARPDVSFFAFDLGQEGLKDPALIGDMLRRLLAEFVQETHAPLPRQEFPIQETISAFRAMAQAKHIGKIVLMQTPHPSPGTFAGFHPNATYLITGGLGDLGLLTARWLVDQGARYLDLVGRSAPSAAAAATIAELEEDGVTVLVAQADVAQPEQVRQVLAKVAETMPPLRGIVHAAGLLDDGVLLCQDWSRFTAVMAPKIEGAWALHELTHSQPLDFFVMFSSTASLLGAPGQGNYAAANSFLDALAHYRRAQGLPATSINWSGWGEIGLAARHQAEGRMAVQSITPIPPPQGLLALERTLRQDIPQVGVIPVDWLALSESFVHGSPPFLSLLINEARSRRGGRQPATGEPTLLHQLTATPSQNRQRVLVDFMREQAGKVLGLEAAFHLDPKRPLNELGLDSLSAIELRNTLGRALGRTLPATLLFDYPAIDGLAGHLICEIFAAPANGQCQEQASHNGKTGEQTNSFPEIDALSTDEIETMLAAELQAMASLIDGD